MSTSITAVVSIGRGAHAAQEPLSADDWFAFRLDVALLLTKACEGTLHVNGAQSRGEWEGVAEDSATFVAEVPQHALASLRAGLGWFAHRYGQDAIALTLGQTEFVKGL